MSVRAILAAALAVVLGLNGCGGSGGAGGQADFKVGLMVSGSTADGGWNQLAATAVQKVAASMPGMKVSTLEKVSPARAGEEMRDYASKGFDLVIGHGYEFMVPAQDVAKGVRKTKFVVSGSDVEDPNVAALYFDLSEASYQLGIVAARQSKTGKIGFIGGAEIPTVIACYAGYEAGAKSVRPDVTVVKAYTSWDRPEQSKGQAEAFIKEGVDAIFQNVDAASKGVFEAVREHNNNPNLGRLNPPAVWVFGSNADQNDNPTAGDWTLGSAVIRMEEAFARQVKAVKDETFKGGVVKEDLRSGVCVAVLNPKLTASGVIAADVVKAVEEAGKRITAGEITVPRK